MWSVTGSVVFDQRQQQQRRHAETCLPVEIRKTGFDFDVDVISLTKEHSVGDFFSESFNVKGLG